jgi:hypothetical protein
MYAIQKIRWIFEQLLGKIPKNQVRIYTGLTFVI